METVHGDSARRNTDGNKASAVAPALHELSDKDRARFWSKVTKSEDPNDCWIWHGSVFSNGYGAFYAMGQNRKANRVSYAISHGAIPEGLGVLHHCDVKRCVNPSHLYAGDHQQNMNDKVARGRQARGDTHYARTRPELLARGEAHGSCIHPGISSSRAKLTDKDVAYIHAKRSEGASLGSIARDLGVWRSTVKNVVDGKLWRPIHVREQ